MSCQPCPESFTAHVRERAVAALAEANEVRHLDLYDEPEPHRAPDDLAWADALVLVYPTWWSSQPAPLLDWIDRCLAARPRYPNLRRIVVVTSHGSTRLVNLVEGEVGRRVVTRGVRSRAHPRCRKDWIALYGIDRSTEEDRRRFVARVEKRLARLR